MTLTHTNPIPAAEAAIRFARHQVPDLTALILAGSVVRDDASVTSDLDLVAIANNIKPHWSTHHELGWPIELFVQNPQSLLAAFTRERTRRWLLLPNMCAEGQILVDPTGIGAEMQATARSLIAAGPEPLSSEEIDWYRYNLTWMLDDFADAADLGEARLMAHDLAVTSIETALHLRRAWLGKGKWLIRNLRTADPEAAHRFSLAFATFSRTGERQPLIAFATGALEALGGRKFAGQSGNW
jgi:hypothetical protein